MIPYGKQTIEAQDIEAVVEVLKSDFLTQGPQVPAFEHAIKQACDVPYALAVNSATSALHIACLALGVGPDAVVWTTPISFVASSNCALYCGATIDFVDIDPKTYNMSVAALEKKLEEAKRNNKLPKVVIPVHLCGQACEMEAIYKLGQTYGFSIIEDASHGIGGKYKNAPIGNCAYSDITVFSFHPVKIITTAEGGVATTKSKDLARKMDLLRSHGVTRDTELMTKAPEGPWYYQMIDLGFNYRMTELQAALGVTQMTRLSQFTKRRHELADRYNELLTGLPLTIPFQHGDSYSGLHLYVIQPNFEDLSKDHLTVFSELREKGIGVNLHYIPIHAQPFYAGLGFKPEDFPAAMDYYSKSISIPLYHGMSNEQQDEVISTLKYVLV